MSDVVDLNCCTRLDIEIKKVIDGLDPDNFNHILILGWDKDDTLYSASNTSDVGEMLHLLELFKHKLLAGHYGDN